MKRSTAWMALVFLALMARPARAADDGAIRAIDDFESDPRGWTYIAGWEFPGAKGGLTRDTTVAHGGKASYKLEADFSGGGRYVGTWKDLKGLGVPDVKEIRFWVKATNVANVGIRLNDSTEQCHQKTNVPLKKTDDWQLVTVKVADAVGGEHWGGANDGKWHAPAAGFGINVGADSLTDKASPKGSLLIDDVTAVVTPPGVPTVMPVTLSQPACRPGSGVRMTFNWDAAPMGKDYTVYVHFVDPTGKIVIQADHDPDPPTSQWSGKLSYTKTIYVGDDVPPGTYRVVLGLYDHAAAAIGWDHQIMHTTPGVTDLTTPTDKGAYQVGVLKIDRAAPLPKLPAPSLDLKKFRLTWAEEFDKPLDVSPLGPGTRWIAHTPSFTDFGDARFTDPKDGFPFTVANGILTITAKNDGGWKSGLLCSVDTKGAGFSQKYGYFEARCKFPKGPGTWPAFWLLGVPSLKEPRDKRTLDQIEIDVVEEYGHMPTNLCTTTHLWYANGKHWGKGENFIVPDMTTAFHTYGVDVEEDFTTYYFDGAALRKEPTLPAAKVPLYILVNLALGGGWPIDKTPSPSEMLVDYVRVYERR